MYVERDIIPNDENKVARHLEKRMKDGWQLLGEYDIDEEHKSCVFAKNLTGSPEQQYLAYRAYREYGDLAYAPKQN